MQRLLLALATTALIAGCSSGVKLDDVPVEDRTATAVSIVRDYWRYVISARRFWL